MSEGIGCVCTKLHKTTSRIFWVLAKDIARRPTHLAEVIPQNLAFIGASDAAKSWMGGVWLPPTFTTQTAPAHTPIIWHAPFYPAIQATLISVENRMGTVTNSDLELGGTIANCDVLMAIADCRHRTIATLCDNSLGNTRVL